MPPERISQHVALNLSKLLEGEMLNYSGFGNRRLLERMIEDRVLKQTKVGRNRSKISCTDPETLKNYLRLQLGIADLRSYLDLLAKDVRDGEESLKATISTKTLRTGSVQGFFIKTHGTEITVAGHRLETLPDGVEYFISDFRQLTLPPKAVVIGVENPECFSKSARLLNLFSYEELVFVLRFHSNQLLRWLPFIGNPYLHFGDFDPAGIAIYCNEYLSVLGNERCSFFVPDNAEELIAAGDPDLFDRQVSLWPPKAEILQPDLKELVRIISRHARGCEQEKLLGQ